MRDATIEKERAVMIGTILTLFLLAIVLLPFHWIWKVNALKESFHAFGPWWSLTIVVCGIAVHELLHATGWIIAGRLAWHDMKFGAAWKSLMVYAHPVVPMPARAYKIGAALPGLVMGLVPALVGMALGRSALAGWGAFFLCAASGDILVLWAIRSLPATARVQDHPIRVGCEILSEPDLVPSHKASRC